jgi:hypothetical protein
MNSGFIIFVTSRAYGRSYNTPFTPTVISEQPLTSHHPHKSLNSMWSFPTPQGLPISLDGLSSRILRIIGTSNCEIPSVGSSLTNIVKSISVFRCRDSETCKANVDGKLEVRKLKSHSPEGGYHVPHMESCVNN